MSGSQREEDSKNIAWPLSLPGIRIVYLSMVSPSAAPLSDSITKAALQKPKSLFMAAMVAAMSADAKIGTILSRNISAFSGPLGDIAFSPPRHFEVGRYTPLFSRILAARQSHLMISRGEQLKTRWLSVPPSRMVWLWQITFMLYYVILYVKIKRVGPEK